MVNTTAYQYPAIGACFDCRQVFLVSDSFTCCLLCGRPPSHALPFVPPVGAPLATPEVPPLPANMSPITVHVALDCPNCGQSFVVLTTDAHIFVIPPAPAPPVEEAAPVELPSTAAASDAGSEPPTPAMGRDFYGNPIPGQLVAPEGDAPEEPSP